uniref:Uncharacterized protein n=1 Tax=Kalanchoe fedtschenkoi TaxID=63787 RepID=A0A7N0ZRV7_KALFE
MRVGSDDEKSLDYRMMRSGARRGSRAGRSRQGHEPRSNVGCSWTEPRQARLRAATARLSFGHGFSELGGRGDTYDGTQLEKG